jgi:phosphoglycerate dehydrogenase-like enzyme
MASECHALRLILCPAAGTDGIDRSVVPAGVQILNSSGPEIPMAEYVIGALVALRQNFFNVDRALRSGRWVQGWQNPEAWTGELFDTNLGLIGIGRTGQEIAKRAGAFGMHCRAVTMHPAAPAPRRELVEELTDIGDAGAVDSLVTWADALAICSELSDVTRDLIDARRFDLMKKAAVLVNIARGPIVVERDFFEALKARRVAGAAIDVWYQYPEERGGQALPSKFPFHELNNVIMTPHSSAWTLPHKRRKIAYWAQTLNAFAKDFAM